MENDRKRDVAPLAVRMRPRTLDEVVGQAEAVGEGSWLRAAIENDALSSVILFGPAGTGKTSLAHVIAESTRATFVEVSAIGGTVSDLRREIDAAEKRLVMGGLRTILFVDEIHRFNRSQQDALAACGGRPARGACGRHHGKPVFRSELSPHLPLAHRGAAFAVRRRDRRAGGSRCGRRAGAGWLLCSGR